jgi:hypothetical protein
MNSQMMIKFMKRLIKDADRKVYLILDNLRVHHSKIVKNWVAKHDDQIALFFLPSYTVRKSHMITGDDMITVVIPIKSFSLHKSYFILNLRQSITISSPGPRATRPSGQVERQVRMSVFIKLEVFQELPQPQVLFL